MREQFLSHLIIIFFSFLFVCCLKIPVSPCLPIFKYKFYNRQWYADITVIVPNRGNTVLQVNFSIRSELINDYKGDLALYGAKSAIQKNISTSNPIIYKLDFPRQDDLPQIEEILLNGRVICFGEKDSKRRISILLTNGIKWYFSNSSSTAPPQMNNDAVSNRFPPDNSANNDVCGIMENLRPIPLIINGKLSEQQPWLVALFGMDTQFFCAGNIISKSHVITAAHCVEEKKYILIAIGTNDISNIYKPNIILRTAQRLYTNSQYKRQTSVGDLAIIVMNEPLHFDTNIRPLCLWPYNIDENLIVGSTAVVSGWGEDETGGISTGLTKKSTLKIVPQEDCRQLDILSSVLSDTTLCAKGLQHATGPCVGDSGGALTLFLDGRWILRGIVSTAIGNSNTGQCDVENYYSVYSDVAKHLDWVRAVLNQ